ncbi:TULIP family P47-like protein [Streptomyces sp. NPDC050738]|uniref:TULIP family P47-like protein n=1 Tax=Streptomyces sp. NPDC050738 TaxID=3154744 RepID=UPI00343BF110
MNIYGWDTVSALSIDAANRSLAQNSARLVTQFKVSGETLGTSYELQGEFGTWRIVPGGSGNILRVVVPIAAGTIRPASAGPVDLAGSSALVDVSLELLPTADGRSQNLVFAMHQAGRVGVPSIPGVVTPVRLNASPATANTLGPVGEGLVLNAVAGALAAHASEVSFVFASLNLVPPASGSWLTPVRSAFVYQEPRGRSGQLVIMSVTTDRDISRLEHTVDPELFATGDELAFAMSQDLLLTKLIAPALPQVFGGGSGPGCFGYDAGRHIITAARRFATNSVKEGAIWYTPQVGSLSVGVVGGQLALAVSGDCDLKAGISMNWWITGQYPMAFDRTGQRVSFANSTGSRSGHSASIPWWFWAGGPLVEAITEVVVTMIADSLAGDLSAHLGSVGLGSLAAQSVHWQGARAFSASLARLNGALMVNGTGA